MDGQWVNYASGALLAITSFRAFTHMSKMKRLNDFDDAEFARAWSGKMLRITGWWQFCVAAVILSVPGSSGYMISSTAAPVAAMGLLLVVWGQAKAPTRSFLWLARRWRLLRGLIHLAR
jgi:hypothetical protein